MTYVRVLNNGQIERYDDARAAINRWRVYNCICVYIALNLTIEGGQIKASALNLIAAQSTSVIAVIGSHFGLDLFKSSETILQRQQTAHLQHDRTADPCFLSRLHIYNSLACVSPQTEFPAEFSQGNLPRVYAENKTFVRFFLASSFEEKRKGCGTQRDFLSARHTHTKRQTDSS